MFLATYWNIYVMIWNFLSSKSSKFGPFFPCKILFTIEIIFLKSKFDKISLKKKTIALHFLELKLH